MPRRKSRKSRQHTKPRPIRWRTRLIILTLVVTLAYIVFLDVRLQYQFNGKRWQLPARVYAQATELYAGRQLSLAALKADLKQLGYQQKLSSLPGTFTVSANRISVTTRDFRFWDGEELSKSIYIDFNADSIQQIVDNKTNQSLDIFRLEPQLIGHFYPQQKEDRLLVKLDDVPPLLVKTLITTEDKRFYEHAGIAPLSIARAMLANLRAGKTVQGGSTLTQQLVKNFFLTNERSLWRKLNEAIMALLLEIHYDKDEILEAYLNEIYLGQDGQRSIHGIVTASEYYFARRVEDLTLPQMALLVALVKGPSYYNPRRHPKRALQRRNLVLNLLLKEKVISEKQHAQAIGTPLGVVKSTRRSASPYPAFLELVKLQLRRDYRESDLTSEGLRIFTTLVPAKQDTMQRIVSKQVARLEAQRRLAKDTIQAASVLVDPQSGEIQALMGSRYPRDRGFNRALHAVRQIGSLVKPFVVLSALKSGKNITVADILPDKPVSIGKGEDTWSPQNFDKQYRGEVTLFDALVNSYNVPMVNLGMRIGLDQVIHTLREHGIRRDIEKYPSLLLGALRLSPMEVVQMYQPFAAGGFFSPLRTIKSVTDADGKGLQRYPLDVRRIVSNEDNYIISSLLQAVMREGTAKSVYSYFPESFHLAGKTGTTDDLRDSWFAGYSGDQLAVVWLGADDNRTIKLTGASGALTVWAHIMRDLSTQPLEQTLPENIELAWIDPVSGGVTDKSCQGAEEMPFIRGTVPERVATCAPSGLPGKIRKTIKDVFDWLD